MKVGPDNTRECLNISRTNIEMLSVQQARQMRGNSLSKRSRASLKLKQECFNLAATTKPSNGRPEQWAVLVEQWAIFDDIFFEGLKRRILRAMWLEVVELSRTVSKVSEGHDRPT